MYLKRRGECQCLRMKREKVEEVSDSGDDRSIGKMEVSVVCCLWLKRFAMKTRL